MESPKEETWRLRSLRILTEPVTERKDSQDDLQTIEDLTKDYLIRAQVIHEGHGVVRGATGLFIPTLKGRWFIEDQQAILQWRRISLDKSKK